MMRGPAIAVAGVALVGALAWLALRAGTGPETGDKAPIADVMTPAPAPAAVPGTGAIERAAVPRMGMARALRAAPARRTVFDEFLASREYRSLYDRLRGTPEGATPKGRLVLYEILRECAMVTGGVPWPFGPRRNTMPKRDEFVAALAPNDPSRERRIAAYEQFTADRCAGLANVTLSQDELMKLLRDSAAGGEPAARALAVEQDLWARRRGSNGSRASPSDDEIQALKEAAGSRDPEAIRVAGRVLANGWSDYALRVGPDELPVEPRPFVNAWLVLACEYGAPCGPDTPRMQQACAIQGHCDAQSFPDYLAYYGSTPHDATLLMQYRAIVRDAIETGDWSQLRVLRGQPQGANRPVFIPGPR